MASLIRRLANAYLRIIFFLYKAIVEAVFQWIYKDSHKPLPPISKPILLETAQNLALKIRTKKLKSEEVLEAYISRIREVNPIINSVVDERFGAAMEEARAVDRLIASGKKTEKEMAVETPLLGVPFTTKDSIAVKGLRQTSGHVGRKDMVASDDADAVKLLRKAGAIPLAVTNVPELCMWSETSNVLHGRTNNPYNNSRSAGGSSGGEGALVSSAGSIIGIGTDIGGSIRIPSFNNGVFGHKPSRGIVSNEGQVPTCEGKPNEYNTTGPICRYSSDLVYVYKILAGSNARLLKLDQNVDLKHIRVYYMEDDGGSIMGGRVDPEIKNAMRKVLKHLETTFGIKPMKLSLKELKHGDDVFITKFATGSKYSFCQEMALRKGSVNPFWELLKWFGRMSNHTIPAIALGIMEKFIKPGSKTDKQCDIWVQDLHNELKKYIKEDAVFLYPLQPTLPLYHNQALLIPSFYLGYTSMFNNLGLPSTACPLGLSNNNLPTGIQVVSWHANDHLSLAMARELEITFGGWVSPSQIL